VLDVNQHSKGGHQALERGNIRVWAANGAKPEERYVAVFNLGEAPEDVRVGWSELGITGAVLELHDLWTHQSAAFADTIHTALRPHASILYRVTTASK